MTVFVRRLHTRLLMTVLGSLAVMTLGVGTVYAEAPLSADQSKQLDLYMQHVGKPRPGGTPAPVSTNITLPSVAHSSDVAVVSAHDDSKTLEAFLALTAPPSIPVGMTLGIASGQGVQPAVPDMGLWDKQAARAIVAAFQNPNKNTTAEQAATYAAATTAPADPAFEERLSLVRTLFRTDGTDALVRKFIATTHMKLIIQEVARHIDFSKLSETDKYRLAAIAAVAQTELEDNVLNINARLQATNLSKPEIMQLIVAFDIDPARKLTQMRLNDDGKQDRAADLDLRLATYQIVKQFEAGQ